MTISIILPLHSQGTQFLDECIKSVIAQTFTDWRLLVGINGGTEISKKQTFNKIQRYQDKRIFPIILNGKPGKIKAMTILLKMSKDKFVCLLDGDDYWSNDKLEKQIKYINTYDIVGSDAEYTGDHSGSPGLFLGKISKEMFSFQNPIIHSAVMCKRKDLVYDERNEGIDDFAMWLTLLNKDKTFFNVPEVLTYHRIHEKSFFNNKNETKYLELKKTLKILTKEELIEMGKKIDDKDWDL